MSIFVRFLLMILTNFLLLSAAHASGSNCANFFGGTGQERAATCEALEFLLTELKTFGLTNPADKKIQTIRFTNDLVYDPENDHWDMGYYDPQTRDIFLVDWSTFRGLHSQQYAVDFTSWQGFVVHELMRHFLAIHGNNAALSFFQEAAYSYFQIQFVGIDKALADYNYPPNSELCGYELSDSLYNFNPIFYQFAAWHWLAGDPAKNLKDIRNGDINLQYIYGVVKRDCP